MRNLSNYESVVVFDLDGTLITGDVSTFFFSKLKFGHKIQFVSYRLLNGKVKFKSYFAKKVNISLDQKIKEEIIQFLSATQKIDVINLLNLLRQDHFLIICSSSPQSLVTIAGEFFNSDLAIGSTEKYLNYAYEKLWLLEECYSLKTKKLCLAISNNPEDRPWMKNFQDSIFIDDEIIVSLTELHHRC